MAEIKQQFDPRTDAVGIDNAQRSLFQRKVISLAAGDGATVDCRGMRALGVVTAAGTTATVTRVDAESDTSPGVGAGRVLTPPAADAYTEYDVAGWGIYRVECSVGSLTIHTN